MVKYIITHCRHDGCYDFKSYEDVAVRTRLASITINPPKLYFFDKKDEANEFFSDYMNDLDVIDNRCKKGDDEIEHVEYCICGIIETDDDGNPNLFYNKNNQLFLMEQSAQVFTPKQGIKDTLNNLNLTNSIIKRCKSLEKEQRQRYIELGKVCQACEDP